jgi:hypothetical protein
MLRCCCLLLQLLLSLLLLLMLLLLLGEGMGGVKVGVDEKTNYKNTT